MNKTTETTEIIEDWDGNKYEVIEELVDNHAGIYGPQEFAEQEDIDEWHMHPFDWENLLSGPRSDGYWESWQYTLEHAFKILPDNRVETLMYRDGAPDIIGVVKIGGLQCAS